MSLVWPPAKADFATPPHIVEAAIKAMRDGYTRYTQVDGIPELKAAIVRKYERENGVTVTPEQISVGTGGKTESSLTH